MVATDVTTTIDGIAAGGTGVGHLPDGRAVFVARTAPGDQAVVRITHEKARWARAALISLAHPGPDRRTPPCPLYADCGGCALQHLDYAAQTAAKGALVADALRRIGGIEVGQPVVVAAPDEFRYRNRATFTLVRAGGRIFAGFHALERPGRILDVDDRCLLLEPALAACWADLRAAWGPDAQSLPSGPRLRLTLQSTMGGCTLLVEGGRGRGRPEALLAATPGLVSVWTKRDAAAAPRLVAGTPAVLENWGDVPIQLRGDAFLQINRAVAGLLDAWVLELCGDVAGRRVVDAYCGIGLLSHRLAAAGARATGIERAAEAVREAAALTPAARFLTGPVERLIQSALPADIVILNPPRTGVDETVCAALRDQPPARLLYISCDPATLARDVARLGDRFVPVSLRCFDMFPQTAHIETVLAMQCATS